MAVAVVVAADVAVSVVVALSVLVMGVAAAMAVDVASSLTALRDFVSIRHKQGGTQTFFGDVARNVVGWCGSAYALALLCHSC